VSALFLVLASGLAWAGRCASLEVRDVLTCSSVIQDVLTAQTPNNVSGPYACPREYLQSGGEHVYTFSCQQSGDVRLLIEDLRCDLDIYVLDESCDTREGCVGESVAGSNSSDEVEFSCVSGQTYMVIIEGFGFQSQASGRCQEEGAGSYTLRFDVSDETGGCQERCDDSEDNDRDGLIDCDDPDCVGESGCFGDLPIIDTSRLPRSCLVGEPCGGSAEADKGALLVIGEAGVRLAEGPPAGVPAAVVYGEAGPRSWTVHVLDEDGQPLASVSHPVDVEQPLRLVAPAVLDFGVVAAGTPTFGEGHCQRLDLSGSVGLADNLFSLSYAAPAEGCYAEPVLRGGRAERQRPAWLPLSGYALGSSEEVCLLVPSCAGESVTDAAITITPQDPRYAGQTAVVEVRWTVEGRSWLSCNAWWLIIAALLLFAVWVVAGFVRPARFPRAAAVTVGGSEKGLRRSAPQILRELRGGRSGFYRDAVLGVHADGSVNGRTKGALLRLRAHRRNGVRVEGAIELLDRRSRQWQAPEDLSEGHVPSPSATYQAGELWLRFEL
jgi:hypothetical protein